jgi:hypothetical protein
MGLPTNEELQKHLAAARKPLDLEELAARGVILKVGSRWKILKPDSMPDHAWLHVSSVEQRTKGGERMTLVGFRRGSRRRGGTPRF